MNLIYSAIFSILCVQVYPQAVPVPPWATEMVNLINAKRQQAGFPQLCINQKLMNVASEFAKTLDAAKTFDHIGPDGSTPPDRAKKANFESSSLSENLASPDTPKGAFDRLFASDPHRANIMNPKSNVYASGGLSLTDPTHTGNWVQMFATSNEPCIDGKSIPPPPGTGGAAGAPAPPPAPGDPPKMPAEMLKAKIDAAMKGYMSGSSNGMASTFIVSGPTVSTIVVDGGSIVVSAGNTWCTPCNTKPKKLPNGTNMPKCKCIEQQ